MSKRVKIKHPAFSDTAWYSKFVGQDFEYITEDENNYYVKTGDKIGSVEKVDGEVIEEQEISTHPLLQDLLQQQKNDVNQVFGPGLDNENVVGFKIMDVGPHDRIGTFCDKCGMPFCICKTEEKRVFESGAKRDSNVGKIRPDLISPLMLKSLGKVLAEGAEHYGERNWEKGIPQEVFKESASRHYLQWMNNETDEDHAAKLIFNVMGFIHNRDKNK